MYTRRTKKGTPGRELEAGQEGDLDMKLALSTISGSSVISKVPAPASYVYGPGLPIGARRAH